MPLKNKFLQRLYNKLVKSKAPEPKRCFEIMREEVRGEKDKIPLIQAMVKRRCKHEPIQYICKEWPFRYVDLLMRQGVLIPRSQTEQLVSILLEAIAQSDRFQHRNSLSFLELGCGSGAIGLSLMKELAPRFETKGVMVDIDPKAVQLTKANAKKNNLGNVEVIEADMRDWLPKMHDFDIVVSNPPYLTALEYSQVHKQVKQYESRTALLGGEDGLQFIKPILEQFLSKCNHTMLMLEYGGQDLTALHAEQHVLEDYYGRRRFVLIR